MSDGLYVRVLLTIIAACLVVLMFRDAAWMSGVHAAAPTICKAR